MKTPRALRSLAFVAMTGLLTAACSSNPEPGHEAPLPGDAAVVVDNTSTTIANATVYLVPETGARQILGTVSMGETARFTVDEPGLVNEYQLVAEAGVDEMVSRSFTLTDGNLIEWDLDLNQVTLITE